VTFPFDHKSAGRTGRRDRWRAVSGLLLLVCVAGLPACEEPTTYADVFPVLERKCNSCHVGGVATLRPYFTSYENVATLGWVMRDAVTSREMPPFAMNNTTSCGGNYFVDEGLWLTTAELETITDWVDQGMARGDLRNLEAPSRSVEQGLSRESALIEMPEPYEYDPFEPKSMHRCFVVHPEVLSAELAGHLLTAFRVEAGSPRTVQNVSLHALDSDEAAEQARGLAEEDDRPGYACFGGPGVESARFVGTWAWGREVVRFPEGTGLPLDTARPLVMQVRYNPQGGGSTPPPDRTRVFLELADGGTEGRFMTLAARAFSLQPGVAEVHVGATEIADREFQILGVAPLMHSLGHKMQVSRVRSFSETCLAQVDHWEFYNHLKFYRYATPARQVLPGDQLRIECQYETRARLVPTLEGQESSDEQCIARLYIVD
jgi:hypothetical protein